MNRNFRTEPLTPDRWGDFEVVMGPQGACYGCWCTYFRVRSAERDRMPATDKKAFMRKRVEAGPPPGLIGYLDEQPVAWVQVTPRADVPNWNSSRTVSRPLEPGDEADPENWAITCFFIVSRHRGTGLSHRMLAAARDYAASNGARFLDACPIDRTKQSKSIGLYVGPSSIFHSAGFREMARRKEGRPLMRLPLAAEPSFRDVTATAPTGERDT